MEIALTNIRTLFLVWFVSEVSSVEESFETIFTHVDYEVYKKKLNFKNYFWDFLKQSDKSLVKKLNPIITEKQHLTFLC